jgi:hypothetical protein
MNKDMRAIFENIKTQYGDVASWASWKAPDEENLSSNMEVDGIFDLDKKPKVLEQIKNNIIMVGLNFSVPLDNPPKLHNFHTYKGSNISHTTLRNASKIRYAFNNTPYYGAYMTDIIKNYAESKSEQVAVNECEFYFEIFRKELEVLYAEKPIIIAFGGKVYNLLNTHLKPNEYSKLIRIPHYAHFGDGCATHEGYRKNVLDQFSK